MEKISIAAVIPWFNVRGSIVEVVKALPKTVNHIIVVDDACPQKSGELVKETFKEPRVKVIFHDSNQGVGGAMITGYRHALENTDAAVILKIDGDGQMDTSRINELIKPIVDQTADYTKGNRFDSIEDLEQMPRYRIFGNAVLSIFSKFSSGYWNITDPTNGFTAIHRTVLSKVKLDKLRKGFFFESDLLFRLSLIRAVVLDVAMPAVYGEENSNLKVRQVFLEFINRHLVNAVKRVFYNYYLREWNIASFELPIGVFLFNFGWIFGLTSWISASESGVAATTGQVMISAVSLLLGTQLILAFLNYDVTNVPKRPRQLG